MFRDWRERLGRDGRVHTISGNVRIRQYFPMPQLRRRRRVWVYLPPGYDDSDRRYPVLYMHDGQNLFDAATSHAGEWMVDKTIDRLVTTGKTIGTIVVAVDNGRSRRAAEYCPGWQGEMYGDFLVHTLKPYIDRHFRTRPEREHTGIAGSSLGGVISLYTGLRYQEVFGRVGAFSPAVFVGQADYTQFYSRFSDTRIYLDVGTREVGRRSGLVTDQSYFSRVVDFYWGLRAIGYDEHQLKLVLDYGAGHSEAEWARRFPAAYLWLFDDTHYWHELHVRHFCRWSVGQRYYQPPGRRPAGGSSREAGRRPADEYRQMFHDMNLMQHFDGGKINEGLCG
ncbi:MAG: alpha/beta hydrolase-fold protein [Negativicutes bacterium]|nr:alpha/beta hydrolase-fold protein [Negativicutes bacterium]